MEEVISGFLEKVGEAKLSSWKRRWFSLRKEGEDFTIYYFKAKDETKEQGKIRFTDIIDAYVPDEITKIPELHIAVKGGRVYRIRTKEQNFRDLWKDNILLILDLEKYSARLTYNEKNGQKNVSKRATMDLRSPSLSTAQIAMMKRQSMIVDNRSMSSLQLSEKGALSNGNSPQIEDLVDKDEHGHSSHNSSFVASKEKKVEDGSNFSLPSIGPTSHQPEPSFSFSPSTPSPSASSSYIVAAPTDYVLARPIASGGKASAEISVALKMEESLKAEIRSLKEELSRATNSISILKTELERSRNMESQRSLLSLVEKDQERERDMQEKDAEIGFLKAELEKMKKRQEEWLQSKENMTLEIQQLQDVINRYTISITEKNDGKRFDGYSPFSNGASMSSPSPLPAHRSKQERFDSTESTQQTFGSDEDLEFANSNSVMRTKSMQSIRGHSEFDRPKTQQPTRASKSMRDISNTMDEDIDDTDPRTFWKRKRSPWKDDESTAHCRRCLSEFTMFFRRHHCRNCGDIFCEPCSSRISRVPGYQNPERVCGDCFSLIKEMKQKARRV